MNISSVAPLHWTLQRWCIAIGLALLAQVGLVFLLAERAPVTPRRVSHPLRFLQVPDSLVARLLTELPLSEPTLFALPNPYGFSGAAWLKIFPLDHRLYEWNEPPLWLSLKLGQMGEGFLQFARTNRPAPWEVADKPAPEVAALELPVPGIVVTQSALRVEGELAKRPLVSAPVLPPWPHTDVLVRTTVQVVVNAAGYPITATVLGPGSGSKAADAAALELAREVRFQPLRQNGPEGSLNAGKTTLGNLIFDWHTVPMATNGVPAGAAPAGQPQK